MSKKDVKRDIVVLNDHEHILLRPEMYVGSISAVEEKVPIINKDGFLINKTKIYSVGMYKILDEVIDNAFDEAKRCMNSDRPLTKIEIIIDSEKNQVTVKDTGQGFKDAELINKKTGISNVETALTVLRAGSNFSNDDVSVNLLGMHGIGVSCTNVLSEFFSVITVNEKKVYKQEWKEFKSSWKRVSDTKVGMVPGTTISFIPRSDVFKEQRWDYELLYTKFVFRKFLLRNDVNLNNIDFDITFDGKKMDVDVNFLPSKMVELKVNKSLKVFAWPCYNDSVSISFVNSSLCNGIHQRMVNEVINDRIFSYEKAHNFYETCIILDLPPRYIKFSDQNKTRFVSTKAEMETFIKFNISEKELVNLREGVFYNEVKGEIEKSLYKTEITKLRKAKKQNLIKISDKFFPSNKKENLLLVEGGSAAGSILQKRNVLTDSVYALRGKIKNTRTLEDLYSNREILDLINILDLNLDDSGEKIKYKRVIIATDYDVDGYHITSLIINFFHKWFPKVIKNGRLHFLMVPLISLDTSKGRKYYYSLDEYNNTGKDGASKIRYLKGLGSYDIKDWDYIFSSLNLIKAIYDEDTSKMLNIAFGDDSNLRKYWLNSGK